MSLIVISRLRNLARRLDVPGDTLRRGAAAAARQDRRARDPFRRGHRADLGGHDERDERLTAECALDRQTR